MMLIAVLWHLAYGYLCFSGQVQVRVCASENIARTHTPSPENTQDHAPCACDELAGSCDVLPQKPCDVCIFADAHLGLRLNPHVMRAMLHIPGDLKGADMKGTRQAVGNGGTPMPPGAGGRRTHLDGGQHQVHGRTLPWGQAPGLLPCHMLLVGRRQENQLGNQWDDVTVSRRCQFATVFSI